jgi:hypothetical protein
MPLDLTKVHEYAIGKDHQKKIVRVRPVIRLNRATEEMRTNSSGTQYKVFVEESGPIYIQDGKCYFADGSSAADNLPGWFEEELGNLTPAALDEVGWGKTTGESRVRQAKREAKEAKKEAVA